MRLSTVLSGGLAIVVVGYGAFSLLTGTDSRLPSIKVLGEGMVDVVEATYGSSCRSEFEITPGNVTGNVAGVCNGKGRCDFAVDVDFLGDPANGCAKDFAVSWRCGPGSQIRAAVLPAEANGRTLSLSCETAQ